MNENMIRQYLSTDLNKYIEIVHLNTGEPKESLYEKIKKKKNEEIFVYIDENGNPVGFIILTPHENGFLIVDWIDADPKFHRKGIGHKLITFAEKKAKEMWLWALVVFTSMETPNAVKFYESCGFKKKGELAGFYGLKKPPGLFYMKEIKEHV